MMAEKKVLYIGFKRQDGILIGGGLANKRCINTLNRRFGEQNVHEYYLLDETKGRSLWSYLLAIILFLFDYHNGLTPHKVSQIIALAKDYDYVFLTTSVIGILAKKLKESGYQGKIITHYHNVESIYYDAQMPRWLPGRQVVVRCAAHNDEYGCRFSDKIITLSQRDSDYLEKHYGRKADAIVNASIEDKCQATDDGQLTRQRPHCLFLGAYSKPNNDGVLFFVRNVLPYVDIEFKVVGKGMSRLQKEHPEMKDIEVVSDAPDLRSYFEEADFMILPVFAGSGMKIKTCESLMYGKNILASDESFVGYHLDPTKVGGLCNTPQEYISRLQYFIENPIPRFNQYSRAIFVKEHSEESTYANFCTLFD